MVSALERTHCSAEERGSQEVHEQGWEVLYPHRDVALVIDVVLARLPVLELHDQYVTKFGRTFASRPKFSCGFSAMLNAVVSLQEKDVGRILLEHIQENELNMSVWNLKELTDSFQRVGASRTLSEIRKCPIEAQEHLEQYGGFDFLAKYAQGVKVVRVAASSFLNHVVVLDCDRRIIFGGVAYISTRQGSRSIDRW